MADDAQQLKQLQNDIMDNLASMSGEFTADDAVSFDTVLAIARHTGNPDLLATAYQKARSITDNAERAEAYLSLLHEVEHHMENATTDVPSDESVAEPSGELNVVNPGEEGTEPAEAPHAEVYNPPNEEGVEASEGQAVASEGSVADAGATQTAGTNNESPTVQEAGAIDEPALFDTGTEQSMPPQQASPDAPAL